MTKVMENYSCSKCNVNCKSRKAAQEHYSSHLHSTNLIRLASKKTTLTQSQYDEMIKKSVFLKKGENVSPVINCKACQKTFSSQGSYETHCRSKRHRENIAKKAASNFRKATAAEDKASAEVLSVAQDTVVEGVKVTEGTHYCQACRESFVSENAYESHAATFKHEKALKLIKLAEDRKANLSRMDKEAEAEENMEVEEVDSDEWEDDAEEEKIDLSRYQDKAIPLSVCIFCCYKSTNLTTNMGHMERVHSFFIPHKDACEIEEFYNYLGEKVGVGMQCIECSHPFTQLRAVQSHMKDMPHMAIRFEGEYDKFFKIEDILAKVHLPAKVPENEWFAFPMPDGSVLTHRNLKRYFRQRLRDSKTSVIKRAIRGNDLKAIGHLAKVSSGPSTSIMERRQEQKKIARNTRTQQVQTKRKNLAVSVKANKLQPHFRHQVQNAG